MVVACKYPETKWTRFLHQVQSKKIGEPLENYAREEQQALERKEKQNKKNKITKLKREDGSWAEKTEEIHGEINNFFQGLYKRDDKVIPQELIDLFPKKVDDRMNETLVKTVTNEEIGDALFQIGPLKAPGPDGFPARFFSGIGKP